MYAVGVSNLAAEKVVYKKEAVSRGYKQKRKGGFIVVSKKR